MILALGERGGDLLDRLEEASAETTRAVLDASERLTTSLNFKTGHVHDEFVDLADRVHEMLNERIDRITSEFEQRSSTIVDGISDRTEQVHDSLKNSSDSLLLELELRSGDLVNKIDEAGNRLATRILTSGDKASDALDVTVNSLVAKVVSQTETAHDTLCLADERVRRTGEEPGRRTCGKIRARQRHARRPDYPPHLGIRSHRQNLRRRDRRSHGPAHPGHRGKPEDLCRHLRHPPDLERRRDHRLAGPAPGAIRDHAGKPRGQSRYLARQQDQILRRVRRRPPQVARSDLRFAGEIGHRNHRQPPWHAGVVS